MRSTKGTSFGLPADQQTARERFGKMRRGDLLLHASDRIIETLDRDGTRINIVGSKRSARIQIARLPDTSNVDDVANPFGQFDRTALLQVPMRYRCRPERARTSRRCAYAR